MRHSMFVAMLMLAGTVAPICTGQTCPGGPVVEFPSGGGTSTCEERIDGRYTITINLTTTAFNVDIVVKAQTTHDIYQIRVIADPGERGWLWVHGSSDTVPCGPIGSVYQEGSGTIALILLRSNGPLGEGVGSNDPAILVDQFHTLVVGGDVRRRIEVSEDSIFDASIGGDLLGDVIVPQFGIDSFVVGGAIGSPSDRVNIWCDGPIKFLAARISTPMWIPHTTALPGRCTACSWRAAILSRATSMARSGHSTSRGTMRPIPVASS